MQTIVTDPTARTKLATSLLLTADADRCLLTANS